MFNHFHVNKYLFCLLVIMVLCRSSSNAMDAKDYPDASDQFYSQGTYITEMITKEEFEHRVINILKEGDSSSLRNYINTRNFTTNCDLDNCLKNFFDEIPNEYNTISYFTRFHPHFI